MNKSLQRRESSLRGQPEIGLERGVHIDESIMYNNLGLEQDINWCGSEMNTRAGVRVTVHMILGTANSGSGN